MIPWDNQELVVYHGTLEGALPSGTRISLGLCSPATDFGQGFYTTTHLHQAKQWANEKVRSTSARGATAIAAVYRFELNRNALAELDWLAFPRPIRDFWSFVTFCRGGASDHNRWARSVPPPLSDVFYDVVMGPVTLWPQTLVIGDCDQISFHTDRAVKRLRPIHHISAGTRGTFR